MYALMGRDGYETLREEFLPRPGRKRILALAPVDPVGATDRIRTGGIGQTACWPAQSARDQDRAVGVSEQA